MIDTKIIHTFVPQNLSNINFDIANSNINDIYKIQFKTSANVIFTFIFRCCALCNKSL